MQSNDFKMRVSSNEFAYYIRLEVRRKDIGVKV